MKVIIDISEDLYNRIFVGEMALNTDDKWELEESVRLSILHGKVFPKTHGRLIDADALKITREPHTETDEYNWNVEHTYYINYYTLKEIREAPTIIEAESEAEE